MALTTQEEAQVRQLLAAMDGSKSIGDMEMADPDTFYDAKIEVVQNGVSKQASIEMIAQAAPVNGLYPDVPINRVTIKRFSGQLSPLYVYEDNTSLKAKILALCKPVLLNRDSLIDTYLSGSNCLKSADGYPANLTSWDKPAMTLIGGFWMKYEYDASTNEKIIKISPYKVKGYKYIRRRFIGMFNGNTVTNTADGTSKTFLCSNYDVYTRQSISLANAHTYAKNLGTHFRAMADQDLDVYALLFSLFKGTVHTQGVYEGITNVNSTNWAAYNKSADGGASTHGQFHKNGATIGLTTHEGEVSLSVTDFPNGAITVKPNRFLWRENGLAGPYYLFTSGRLIIDNVVWQVNDLADIAFTKTGDYVQLCSLAEIAPSADGFQRILETYQDTLMPSAIGGSATTGMCDQWYGLAAPTTGVVYVPARLGYAAGGAIAGLRCLFSSFGPSYARAYYGVSLASDDPTDTIADGTIAS
jgi:hypothetical protein